MQHVFRTFAVLPWSTSRNFLWSLLTISALYFSSPVAVAMAETNPPPVLAGGGSLIIATNRTLADPTRLSTTSGFSSRDRSEHLSFALVSREQGESNGSQPIAVRLVKPQELNEVLKRTSNNAAATPHPVLVYVHGFNNTTESAVHLAVHVANKMRFAGHVIVFSWPSRGAMSRSNYLSDVATANVSKGAFLELLAALRASPSVDRIHVIAHSLGNRVLTRSLVAMSTPASSSKLGQIILCSPDVGRTEFIESVRRITPLVQGATLWASNNDRALRWAPIFGEGGPRAGLIPDGGEPIVMPELATIDVSNETELFAFNHNAYMQVDQLFADLADVLDQGMPRPWLNPVKNAHYIAKTTRASRTYWQYKK